MGLTVVAFGTSAPELLVSLEANGKGSSDVALGNVIGSNICNIGLILGLSAIIKPVVIHRQIIKREMPILIVSSLVFVWMLSDKVVETWEGALLFGGILAYVIASLIQCKKEKPAEDFGEFSEADVQKMHEGGWKKGMMSFLLIIVGLAALKYGSE